MSILSLPVTEFLARAASRSPAPGGGALAAVTGAEAAALVSMVGELTIGRKRYQDVETEVSRIREQAIDAMRALQQAAIEDADSYQAYLGVSAMPQDDSAARELRRREVALAVVRMTHAPLTTAERCVEVLALARQLAPIGAVHAISDVGVALHLAHAALQSALLTVDGNLPFLRDEELAEQIQMRRKSLFSDASNHFLDGIKDFSERKSG